MRAARPLPGLLAGLVAFDLLLNLPGFSTASPAASLLAPSIDLLVITAACMGTAQTGQRARQGLGIVVTIAAVLLIASRTGARFGFDVGLRLVAPGTAVGTAASCLLSLAILAAAAGVSYLLVGLLVRGFAPPITRSVVLLLIALLAVLQVLTGRRLFSASVIPRIVSDIGSHLR